MELALPLYFSQSSPTLYFVMTSMSLIEEDKQFPPSFKANIPFPFRRAALRHFNVAFVRSLKFPSRMGSVPSILVMTGPESILKQPICLYSVEETLKGSQIETFSDGRRFN